MYLKLNDRIDRIKIYNPQTDKLIIKQIEIKDNPLDPREVVNKKYLDDNSKTYDSVNGDLQIKKDIVDNDENDYMGDVYSLLNGFDNTINSMVEDFNINLSGDIVGSGLCKELSDVNIFTKLGSDYLIGMSDPFPTTPTVSLNEKTQYELDIHVDCDARTDFIAVYLNGDFYNIYKIVDENIDFIIDNLESDTAYNIDVFSCDVSRGGTNEIPGTLNINTEPHSILDGPTSVTLLDNSYDSINIVWDNIRYADYYSLVNVTTGESFISEKNHMQLTGLIPNNDYNIKIRPIDISSIPGNFSDEFIFSTLDLEYPEIIEDVIIDEFVYNECLVTFDYGENTTGFNVYKGDYKIENYDYYENDDGSVTIDLINFFESYLEEEIFRIVPYNQFTTDGDSYTFSCIRVPSIDISGIMNSDGYLNLLWEPNNNNFDQFLVRIDEYDINDNNINNFDIFTSNFNYDFEVSDFSKKIKVELIPFYGSEQLKSVYYTFIN